MQIYAHGTERLVPPYDMLDNVICLNLLQQMRCLINRDLKRDFLFSRSILRRLTESYNPPHLQPISTPEVYI